MKGAHVAFFFSSAAIFATLGAETFAGRKFRDFRVFLAFFAKVSAKA